MTSETSGHSDFIERIGGRVILIDEASGAILLIRGCDPRDIDRGDFWITPGGGLDEGEDVRTGTARELWEEVGLAAEPHALGPVVLRRVGEFRFAGDMVRQTESYFAMVVERFEPTPQVVTAFEEGVIQEIRWCTRAEISSATEPVYPWCLLDLSHEITSQGAPNPPWDEEQRLA